MVIERKLLEGERSGTTLLSTETSSLASASVSEPGLDQATLEFVVAKGDLFRVKFRGEELSDLCGARIDGSLQGKACRGAFGVFASAADADFSNARIILEED